MTKQMGRNPAFCRALREGGIEASVAVDMECALNSGCVAVLLGNAEPPEEFVREFARFPPQLSFADGADLFRALEGLRFGAMRPSS
jgi:hypothetical protein